MAKRSKSKIKGVLDGGIPAQVPATDAVGPRLASWFGRDWFLGLTLILVVFLAYQPVWHAGFIWDDDDHVTANPCIIGPLGLKEIWTTSHARYYPLVLTTFWVEHALWGLAPLPYHLVNVLMHGVCAIVLWRVLRSLQVAGAWLGAALWAVHPVQVETVAWITELKNVQSCLFYLLSVLFFVKWLRATGISGRSGDGWNYALTLLFAALAMTSKSSTVVLPLVLCLCAWWVESRWQWRSVARVIPVFFMSGAAAILALWTVDRQGVNIGAPWAQSWPERLITAGNVVWFYLGKLAWPHPLIFIYPRWAIDSGQWVSYLPLLAVVIVAAVLWRKRESWGRPYFFALAYFLAALLPVLGLVEHYFLRYSFVADHLQYLASMGPLALAGAGLATLADFALPKKLWLQSSLCAGLLLVPGMLSWQRAWAYQSEDILWTETLAQDPNCWVAHNNLGILLYQRGEADEAIAQYRKALEINSRLAEPHNNLGNALIQKRQVDGAIAEYQKALEIDPTYDRAHNNLGNALSQKGQVDEAIAQYQTALEIDPDYVDAYSNLGLALLQRGRVDEAITNYQKVLAIDPNLVQAHNNLGNALNEKGEVEEAMVQYQKALEIDPNNAEAHSDLGVTLLQKGEAAQAVAQFQRALAINPNYSDAHYNLGYALVQKGRVNEAIIEFQEVVRLNPGNKDAQDNLARAQALAKARGLK